MVSTFQAVSANPGFALIVAGMFTALGWWIKGIPQRLAARTADMVVENNNDINLRAEVVKLASKLHAMGNEVMMVKAQVLVAEGDSRNLTFVIQLVMDELHSINPENKILQKARGLLLQISVPEPGERAAKLAEIVKADRAQRREDDAPGKSDNLQAVEDTEAAATDAVWQVRESERDHKQ